MLMNHSGSWLRWMSLRVATVDQLKPVLASSQTVAANQKKKSPTWFISEHAVRCMMQPVSSVNTSAFVEIWISVSRRVHYLAVVTSGALAWAVRNLYASYHLSCLKLIKARGLRDVMRKNHLHLPSNTPLSRLWYVTTETTNYAIFHPTTIPRVYHFSPCSRSLDFHNSMVFFPLKKFSFSLISHFLEWSLVKGNKKRAWEDRGWEMTGVKTVSRVAFV